ncbi:SRPBCC family protein [Streptomyces sp. Y7]|uniref:SRPBCC family protein n=1 Tax=Streptomyces sp. Y7 TaxID=3342392 RepID=UPI003713794C
MISISREFPVNEPGETVVNRSQLWRGLEMKARNATLFVRRMQSCVVIEDGELEFTRDIVIRDEPHREHITFTPEEKVRFERIGGNTRGYITNEIHEDTAGNLVLRFTFNLERTDLEPGGAEERTYFAKVDAEYEDAVRTTLETTRQMVRDEAGETDASHTGAAK